MHFGHLTAELLNMEFGNGVLTKSSILSFVGRRIYAILKLLCVFLLVQHRISIQCKGHSRIKLRVWRINFSAKLATLHNFLELDAGYCLQENFPPPLELLDYLCPMVC